MQKLWEGSMLDLLNSKKVKVVEGRDVVRKQGVVRIMKGSGTFSFYFE